MEISRSLNRHGNVQPPVFSILADLPTEKFHHAAHGLRPPGGIYNVSIDRVIRAFVAVLDQIDALAAATRSPDGRIEFAAEGLLAAQTELLESMLAHVDDAYQILKACSPPQPQIQEPFADRWLEKARHPSVRQFKNAVKRYRDGVAAIVNREKHEHGQLRFVVFSDSEMRVPGYYLEAVGPGGVLQPDEKVHPGFTAFSFDRDLRLHFVQLFGIGEALKGALLTSLRAQHIPVSGRPVQNDSAALLSVAERLAALGTVVFPDEAAKATPHVRVRREGEDAEVAVRFPNLAVMVPTKPGMVTTTAIRGDGYSSQYRVPYFKGR